MVDTATVRAPRVSRRPAIRLPGPSRSDQCLNPTIRRLLPRKEHPMRCLGVVLVALLALGPTLWVEDDPGGEPARTPREEFEALVKKHGATTPSEQFRAHRREYEEAREGCERALREAKSDEERRRVRDESNVGPWAYTHLFQVLARLHPSDPASRSRSWSCASRRRDAGRVPPRCWSARRPRPARRSRATPRP